MTARILCLMVTSLAHRSSTKEENHHIFLTKLKTGLLDDATLSPERLEDNVTLTGAPLTPTSAELGSLSL